MTGVDPARLAALGLNRFGLGPRPGDLAAIGGDIRGALLVEIARRQVVNPSGASLLPSPEAYRRFHLQQEQVRALRVADRAPQMGEKAEGAQAEATDAGAEQRKQTATEAMAARRELVRDIFQSETLARVEAGKEPRCGFAERLVLFWSNHFCVSVRKGGILRVLAGPYEREAIRPHIFGRFADMLLAVEKHPAMLVYLDNVQSIGPNSRGGQRLNKGLNENLAREIMELHTLGVDGGYTQEDVTELARMLTGWRFARNERALAPEGQFVFNPNLHEPGDHKLLGVVYRETGLEQGEEALRNLARRPATARHIARKLAIHFVADEPDPALTGRLEKAFLESDGDLAVVSKALIEAPEAWNENRSKLRAPYEFLIASMRLTGATLGAPQINRALAAMGQPLWNPPGPNGFPDSSESWASPEGMKARLEFAAQFSQSAPGERRPDELLDEALGPLASPETRKAVAQAESRAQGLTLLLMSPEFQRR